MMLKWPFKRGPAINVHVLLRGRMGEGWYDVDESLALRQGTTLSELLDAAERRGIPLRRAITDSPHLAHTLMLNGERCPLADNMGRELHDGDQLYLLSPIAGG